MCPLGIVNEPKVVVSMAGLYGTWKTASTNAQHNCNGNRTFDDGRLGIRGWSCRSSPEQNGGSGELEKKES